VEDDKLSFACVCILSGMAQGRRIDAAGAYITAHIRLVSERASVTNDQVADGSHRPAAIVACLPCYLCLRLSAIDAVLPPCLVETRAHALPVNRVPRRPLASATFCNYGFVREENQWRG